MVIPHPASPTSISRSTDAGRAVGVLVPRTDGLGVGASVDAGVGVDVGAGTAALVHAPTSAAASTAAISDLISSS
jgi:hypothetical protein